MNGTVADVARLLKPGYRLIQREGAMQGVIDPKGNTVRQANGQPILINGHHDEGHQRRRTLGSLRDVGAIPKPDPRVKKRHEPVRIVTATEQNPILLANGIIKSKVSTPSERRIAKAYLNLIEEQQKVRAALAAALKVIRENDKKEERAYVLRSQR